MSTTPAPHEIRLSDGSPAYRCRNCRTDKDLQWFGGTSCPVCDDPICSRALRDEYNASYEDLSNEQQQHD